MRTVESERTDASRAVDVQLVGSTPRTADFDIAVGVHDDAARKPAAVCVERFDTHCLAGYLTTQDVEIAISATPGTYIAHTNYRAFNILGYSVCKKRSAPCGESAVGLQACGRCDIVSELCMPCSRHCFLQGAGKCLLVDNLKKIGVRDFIVAVGYICNRDTRVMACRYGYPQIPVAVEAEHNVYTCLWFMTLRRNEVRARLIPMV